ncbi:uncharacterized protein LOC126843516 [Adelges cooleyi]|uniref:uncharacterized protein LOC126843516 n=1 Tax=Adelges cooleyi TaxID=133065 RepID=UPI00217F444A|nr:uncharacterized protein LOC126843516 [Adelges cooleyi]
MNSHLFVFLLCLSGGYCISSTIENLDLDGLKLILRAEPTIKEWDAAMDQKIIYEHPDGRRTAINVRKTVYGFKQKLNNCSVEEFKWIHDIIKLAYQCTLTKYASITTWLIFQNLWKLKNNIYEAILYTKENTSDFNAETIFENETFKRRLVLLNNGNYYLDFDFKLDFKLNSDFLLYSPHEFDYKTKKDIYLFWADMLVKTLGSKIKYKIYADVFTTKFTNEYDQPIVDTINELICVLNETIKLCDKFILNKCVRHAGSFVRNFESLSGGVNGRFLSVLNKFDKIKTMGSKLELFKDFTKSIPGTLPVINPIMAPGCFVENLEFQTSGLKTVLPNPFNPTLVYGLNLHQRISEIQMKLVESIDNQPQDGCKIGMILFRDAGNSSDPQPSGSTSQQQHGESSNN